MREMCFCGILFLFSNYFLLALLEVTDPVTHAVLNTAKRVVVTVFSVVVLGSYTLNLRQMFGCALSLFGTVYFFVMFPNTSSK